MYAGAERSWTLLSGDAAAPPPAAETGKWPLLVSFSIMLGTSAGLWFGIIQLVSLVF